MLGVQYADDVIMYVCGTDPATARASQGIHEAVVFSSPQEALSFRDRLPHQEGTFATQYTVREWQADDHAMPV